MGRDYKVTKRDKLRGRTKPQTLLFARGSATPTTQPSASIPTDQWHAALDIFIR